MIRAWIKDVRTPLQINTHIIKGMKQVVLDALDFVALNRK